MYQPKRAQILLFVMKKEIIWQTFDERTIHLTWKAFYEDLKMVRLDDQQ